MKLKERVIILQYQKFDWKPEQIKQAKLLFAQGVKPSEVAEIMNQKVIDIGLLLLHLIDKGQIKEGMLNDGDTETT